jgi:thymidylate kinase
VRASDQQRVAETRTSALTAAPAAGSELIGVRELFATLESRGIRYCHWKSNLRLRAGLEGRTDLDLLIARRDAARFRETLFARDLKLLVPDPSSTFPAVEHYLGFDRESGRLFHLHVHYQLVLGEQITKSYRLPIEGRILLQTQLMDDVRVPTPELELIILSLRALLKYRDRDVIKDVLGIRSRGIKQEMLEEVEFLHARTSRAALLRALDEVRDVVPATAVMRFLEVARGGARSGYTLYRLRAAARRSLRPHRRHGELQARFRYAREVWKRSSVPGPRPARPRKMQLANGGLTVALVGIDGAGKSTLQRELSSWLGWKLDIRQSYFGSKSPSRVTRALYVGFRALRRLQRTASGRLGSQHPISTSLASGRDTLSDAHRAITGLDRYRAYRESRRSAIAGSIVIYDRFPLSALSPIVDGRLMDGPVLGSGSTADNVLRGRLGELERRIYRRIRPPDLVFALDLNPSVSLARKRHQNPPVLDAKAEAIADLTSDRQRRRGDYVLERIDASASLDEVLRRIKELLWEAL